MSYSTDFPLKHLDNEGVSGHVPRESDRVERLREIRRDVPAELGFPDVIPGRHLGGLHADGSAAGNAQDAPLNIRAELLARDAGRALDGGAVGGRDATQAPRLNRPGARRRDGASERGRAAGPLDRLSECGVRFHAADSTLEKLTGGEFLALRSENMKTKAGDVIRIARERLGLTKQELADRVGVSRGSISQWELGLTAPKRGREEQLARVLGLSPADLFHAPPDLALTIRDEETGRTEQIAVELKAGGVYGGVYRVPRLDRIPDPMQGVTQISEDVILGSVDLSSQWVTQRIRPSDPAALRVLTAQGDGMSPTFGDGDLLLIDTGVDHIGADGVYCIRAAGRFIVRRVRQKLEGGYIVSSDNPADRAVDEIGPRHQIEVIGRVVWTWNGRKL